MFVLHVDTDFTLGKVTSTCEGAVNVGAMM